MGAATRKRKEREGAVPSSPLENKVFKPIFSTASKPWEYFRDFVAVM